MIYSCKLSRGQTIKENLRNCAAVRHPSILHFTFSQTGVCLRQQCLSVFMFVPRSLLHHAAIRGGRNNFQSKAW